MIVIGVDSHKRTHTAVAVDPTGRKLAEKTVAGDGRRTPRAPPLGGAGSRPGRSPSRTVATSRGASSDLLVAGETVVRVPPKLMAGARRSAVSPARAIRSTPSRSPGRRCARTCQSPPSTGVEREPRLLVDHRDDLVAERTRAQNRLRWHLHELDPGNEPAARGLDRARSSSPTSSSSSPPLDGTVARIARELVARIRELTAIDQRSRARDRSPRRGLAPSLLALPGCGR